MATVEEYNQERADALAKQYKDEFDEAQQAAIDARADQPDQGETEEEYYARVSVVPGIFGEETASVIAAPIEDDVETEPEVEEPVETPTEEAEPEVENNTQPEEAVELTDARENAAVDPANPDEAGDVQN